jgi:hypothetical protein
MFDDLERLRTNTALHELLVHYAILAENAPDTWQDRLMSLDGVDTRELARLHGELIACDWIEQNTGQCGTVKPGIVPGCYRVTAAGLRAIRKVRPGEPQEEPEELVVVGAEPEPPWRSRKRPRKRK